MRDFENLGAYLPATVLKQLVDGQFQIPQERNFTTVCLFADVSGFTVLSEKLCAEGQQGIEELAAQLNKYMAQIVKLTSRAGGDVLKFAGDALISIFNEDYQQQEGANQLANAVLRAIQCSLDMQLRLTDFRFSFLKTDSEGRSVSGAKEVTGELNIKLGIGLGDCSLLYVGGESDNVMPERYEYVAMGQALEEAFDSESAAVKGQVVISKAAYLLVQHKIVCEPLAGGKHYLVHAVKKSEELTWKKKEELASFTLSPEIENNIWRCVPAAVLPYLNESNEFWAPELRRVTTLFVNLGYSEEDMALADAPALHSMYRAMQQCVFQFEGTINKFLCDDKGSTLLVVFGLPPFAHENDATRGVLAAMSILTTLKELGKSGSVGITTGEAFCGVVGTRGNRREYSVIGDVVNVSARLMSESKKQHCGHLMDSATKRAIEADGFRTIYFTSVLLKGKAYELPVYQVSGEKDDLPNTSASSPVSTATSSSQLTSPGTQKKSVKASGGNGSASASSSSSKKKATGGVNSRPSLIVLGVGGGSGITPGSALLQQLPAQEEEASEAQKLAAANPANVRAQVSAITEAPRLKAVRETALQRLFDEREKAGALEKALSSFARASEKGLKMGSGRAKTAEEVASVSTASPPPVALNPTRVLKAAQITFASCSTASGTEALSTVFTLPLVTGIDTVFDLKDAALTRLGNRRLLAKGPQADRAYFTLEWLPSAAAAPSSNGLPSTSPSSLADESALLDELAGVVPPMIRLVLVEHDTKQDGEELASPTNGGGPTTPGSSFKQRRSVAMSFSTFNTPRDRLEVAKLRLLSASQPAGSIVVLEGAQGVGKSFLAEDVLLRSGDLISSALTAVAMGNPYENELPSCTLNVWTLLLRQVLEEAMMFRDLAPSNVDGLLALCRDAVLHLDPSFPHLALVNEVCESALDTGHLPATSGLDATRTVRVIALVLAGLSLTTGLPVVLLVDDSHFMDLASWQVVDCLAGLLEQRPHTPLLLVLLHRNIIQPDMFSTEKKKVVVAQDDALSAAYNNMRALDNQFTAGRREVQRIYVELLAKPCVDFVEKKSDVNDTERILQDTLDTDTLRGLSPLVDFLKLKTQGNRMFISGFVDDIKEAGLIVPSSSAVASPAPGGAAAAVWALTDEFRERLKYHELPLPTSVEGICATLIDSMSIAQQMALKVAAIIGERFTLGLVTALFPIAHLKPTLQEEWDTLVRLGVVVERTMSDNSQQPAVADPWYVFGTPWMLETLRKRMLFKQRRKLAELYKNMAQERERELNQKYMESAVNKLSVFHNGYLAVKKENARNVLQPWKRRWLVLQQDELIQYYEENNTVKRLEVIKLSAAGTTISNKIGGFIGAESAAAALAGGGGGGGALINSPGGGATGEAGRHFPFCFVVHAKVWSKKDVFQTKPRDFYMAPESLKEQQDWVFKVGFQIDFFKIKAEEDAKRAQEATRKLVANLNVESVVAGFGDNAAAAGARDKNSAAAPPADAPPAKYFPKLARPSFTMSMVKSRPKSNVPSTPGPAKPAAAAASSTLDAEYAEPGKHVLPMTAANFKAISRDEALATFWASETTTLDEVMVLRSGHHITFFYELGDMALVSLNGQGAVDGYLLGFVSSRSPEVAVVHQIAVLPMVRRRGIATKLMHEFFELAKRKSCQTVRALVPRDAHVARAFHQRLGFDLNHDEDAHLLEGTELIVFTRPLYKQAGGRSQATSTLPEFEYDDEEEDE